MNQSKEKVVLDKLELHTSQHGEYYLSAEYTRTTKTANSKITIPRIILPVSQDDFTISKDTFTDGAFVSMTYTKIDLGFGKLLLDSRFKMTEQIVEEFQVEMTIAEIERELGHKIKIVSGGEEKTDDKN